MTQLCYQHDQLVKVNLGDGHFSHHSPSIWVAGLIWEPLDRGKPSPRLLPILTSRDEKSKVSHADIASWNRWHIRSRTFVGSLKRFAYVLCKAGDGDTVIECVWYFTFLEMAARKSRRGRDEGAAARCLWQEGRRGEGEGEWGYEDNFLSALIALTVCRLPPSWRSLIEITCT